MARFAHPLAAPRARSAARIRKLRMGALNHGLNAWLVMERVGDMVKLLLEIVKWLPKTVKCLPKQ